MSKHTFTLCELRIKVKLPIDTTGINAQRLLEEVETRLKRITDAAKNEFDGMALVSLEFGGLGE